MDKTNEIVAPIFAPAPDDKSLSDSGDSWLDDYIHGGLFGGPMNYEKEEAKYTAEDRNIIEEEVDKMLPGLTVFDVYDMNSLSHTMQTDKAKGGSAGEGLLGVALGGKLSGSRRTSASNKSLQSVQNKLSEGIPDGNDPEGNSSRKIGTRGNGSSRTNAVSTSKGVSIPPESPVKQHTSNENKDKKGGVYVSATARYQALLDAYNSGVDLATIVREFSNPLGLPVDDELMRALSSTADDDGDGGSDEGEEDDLAEDGKKKKLKKPRKLLASNDPNARLERARERNRVHARRSRLRKKFFNDALVVSMEALQHENKLLRQFLYHKFERDPDDILTILLNDPTGASIKLPDSAIAGGKDSFDPLSGDAKLSRKRKGGEIPESSELNGPFDFGGLTNRKLRPNSNEPTVIAPPHGAPQSTLLDRVDYELVNSLTQAEHNFVVTDPNMPDNPIVFASPGFYALTQYTPKEIIGYNCRFLQGKDTDPIAVELIRVGVRNGFDTAVCLLNYKKDGTPFWNRFFIAPLKSVDGKIVNFIGVQCPVSERVGTFIRDMQRNTFSHLLKNPKDSQKITSSLNMAIMDTSKNLPHSANSTANPPVQA
jgi:PAS domain